MLPDHQWIAQHIPHHGKMCLIDHVTAWTDDHIDCIAISHTDPANPLRHLDQLSIVCGIEYAAQAMAIHGALLAPFGAPAKQGYLASARHVNWTTDRLDTLDTPLLIHAESLSHDAHATLYQFFIRHRDCDILTGRASIVFVN